MSTFNEICKRDARMISLQAELLDHSGHVWPNLPQARRRALVSEINQLRGANGFALLDMRNRTVR
jgi:hypothetical protein